MEVPAYACRAQRWQLLAQCLATEAAYLAAVGLLASRNLVAALWVFVIPYLLTSLALMFGNWCVLRLADGVQRRAVPVRELCLVWPMLLCCQEKQKA